MQMSSDIIKATY